MSLIVSPNRTAVLGQKLGHDMARPLNRLSARAVATIAKHGRHSDGGGLYLSISPNGGRRWVFMFRQGGKQREIGLGSARDVTLVAAREQAATARADLARGAAPTGARRAAAASVTFGVYADSLVEALKPGWRNAKHAAQWAMTLTKYAAPLRSLSVSAIVTDDVLGVLKPIWQSKPETASRLRSRIERVLDAATAANHREGPNPARWRGNLKSLLPPPAKLSRGHHAAMDYAALPAFIKRLRERPSVSALALEFAILTAARSSEVVGARSIEINGATWTVPGERMKAGREHAVPLSPRAVEIVETVRSLAGVYLFPSPIKRSRPLTGAALTKVLSLFGASDVTVHGFRSTFRDWVAEETATPNIVAEMALAHAIKDKTEKAYRRKDLFKRRAALMNDWATYCDG